MKHKILESKKSTKSIIQLRTMEGLYDQMMRDKTNTKPILIKQIIDMCYNNKENQLIMSRILNMNYQTGSITINPIPAQMFQKFNLIKQILEQVKNIKIQTIRQKKYACWIVINKENSLQLMFLTKAELKNNVNLFDYAKNLIGIFIVREYINIQNIPNNKEKVEEKTTKTNATTNTQNTNNTNQTKNKKIKRKENNHSNIDKIKSCSLKGQRKIKSKSSSKQSIKQSNKIQKNKSTYLKYTKYIKQKNEFQQGNSNLFSEQKIFSKKLKQQKKKPMLYKKKLQLINCIKNNNHSLQ